MRSFICRLTQLLHVDTCDFLDPPLVFNVETVRIRTVEVEYAHQRIIPVQRYHQFGARRRVAGDVAFERIDVGHALGIAAARRRAAHALVERDADAGRLALERADHQLVAIEEVEARSEEHTSELQSLMRISYAVFCLKKKKKTNNNT